MISFIVNTRSGNRDGERALKVCAGICDAQSLDYRVYPTKYAGHAEEYAKGLGLLGDDLVVAIGGDGTFHEVLNGIEPGRVAIGFVPSGHGNDFARAAELSMNHERAFRDILYGEKKKIDYFTVGDRRCLNIAGTGMDVDVLEAVYGKRNALTYYTSLLACLARFKPYDIRVCVNGEVVDRSCVMVGVCNGIAFGGGIRISPQSKIDSGKLELIILEKKQRSLRKILPGFMAGKHLDYPEVTHMSVEEVNIINFGLRKDTAFDESMPPADIELDGEIYSGLPFSCKIVPGGLTTFTVGHY